ncbi:phage terminase small subunit P27 family [Clostridium sp. LY3-2]|uniref:phage terminase small subunit P27 family n=1 Tax=Clostridium sp. LY3-2 TaxID=2942482 RepID=UPI0021537E8A|nr:phage terminase small subunit P27 family [Clostridium sp. LY3-2]MCR6515814.1 phage terminase small subunit P27 family [Clostridium sp. LY3-2]
MAKLKCPSFLDKDAKKEWKRIIKLFEEEKKEITEKDIKALERYCASYSDILKFSSLLDQEGYLIYSKDGYPQQHPYYQMKNKAIEEMRNWMKELGLTPASRARMNKKIVMNSGGTDEEMEEMISK